MYKSLNNLKIITNHLNKVWLSSRYLSSAPAINLKINYKHLLYKTKVPQTPHESNIYLNRKNKKPIEIDEQTLLLLERLSLVGIDNKEAFKILQDSIEFASIILDVDTTGVEPLYSVLENHNLRLREDDVTDGNIREDILKNARITEEDYFVAPPGNIPLEQETKKF